MANSDNTFKDASPWELPPVGNDESKSERTNALNRPLYKWQFEPPESAQEDEQPLTLPTLEQIEEIQQSAHNDGFETGKAEGLEAGHKEGYDKGYEEGLAAGTEQAAKEAYEQSSTEIKQHISELKSIIDTLQNPLKTVSSELKKELSLLTVSLAKFVIMREVERDDEILLESLSQALEHLPIKDNTVDISIASSQKEFIESQLPALFENNDIPEIRLLTDATLAPGGCKVETLSHAVDMSIERRCEQVFSQVLNPLELDNDPRAD